MVRAKAASALLFAFLAGCTVESYQSGALLCDQANGCPNGLFCDAASGRCVAGDGGGVPSAGGGSADAGCQGTAPRPPICLGMACSVSAECVSTNGACTCSSNPGTCCLVSGSVGCASDADCCGNRAGYHCGCGTCVCPTLPDGGSDCCGLKNETCGPLRSCCPGFNCTSGNRCV